MSQLLRLLLLAWFALSAYGAALGQDGSPVVTRWKLGVVIRAEAFPAMGIRAGIPLFTEWPEQEVKTITQDASATVKQATLLKLGDGAQHLVVNVPKLAQGEMAEATLIVEVTKRELPRVKLPEQLRRPVRVSAELKRCLAPSPLIESSDATIVALSKEIVAGKATAWEQAEAIYDWVQSSITYENGALKGARAALQDRRGDCEEMTSLFIALCRAQSIPARTVWVPGHCYPEFYLEDAAGAGHWIPCQAAGTRMFGIMHEARPIFQKGDSSQVPGHREKSHYAHAWLTSAGRRGLAPPKIEVVVKQLGENAEQSP